MIQSFIILGFLKMQDLLKTCEGLIILKHFERTGSILMPRLARLVIYNEWDREKNPKFVSK